MQAAHERRTVVMMQMPILRAGNLISRAMEIFSLSPGIRKDLSHRALILDLDGFFFLSVGVRAVLGGKEYCTIDMVLLIRFGPMDRLTEYTRSRTMTRAYAIYSSLMSEVTAGRCKRGWPMEELRAIIAEMCQFMKRCGIVIFCLFISIKHNKVPLAGSFSEVHQNVWGRLSS